MQGVLQFMKPSPGIDYKRAWHSALLDALTVRSVVPFQSSSIDDASCRHEGREKARNATPIRGRLNVSRLSKVSIYFLLIVGGVTALASDSDTSTTKVPTLCSPWLRQDTNNISEAAVSPRTPCNGYDADSIDRVNFVINEVLLRTARTPADVPAVFPGPPVLGAAAAETWHITDSSGAVVSGYVGLSRMQGGSAWPTPARLPQGWIYHYALHRVAAADREQVLKRLKAIERTRFYNRFRASENPALPYLVFSDWFAEYARHYDVEQPTDRQALLFPDEWEPHITTNNMRELWVVATVRVDDSWFPTAPAERRVLPIAVRTTSDLYLVSEEVRPQRMGGGTVDRFQGRIFDLTNCRELQQCTARVLAVFSSELNAEFAKAPLSAPRVHKALPPHQLRYQRLMELSIPLKGLAGPYYELSTYTVTVWPATAGSFMGTADNYFTSPKRSAEDQIFLQLSQSLQIAVGKSGEYSEPTAAQYGAYQAVLDNAIRNAVARTTKRLGGRLADDVGIITAVSNSE